MQVPLVLAVPAPGSFPLEPANSRGFIQRCILKQSSKSGSPSWPLRAQHTDGWRSPGAAKTLPEHTDVAVFAETRICCWRSQAQDGPAFSRLLR